MTVAMNPRDGQQSQFTLGQLLLIFIVVCVLVAMFVTATSRPRAYLAECQNNLSQLYKSMLIYKAQYGSNLHYMPHTGDAFWTCLLGHAGPEHPSFYENKAPLRDYPDLFCCPATGSKPSSAVPGGQMKDYLGPKRHPSVPSSNPSSLIHGLDKHTVILCDAPGNHIKAAKAGGGNVLRLDGSGGFVEGDEYTEALSKCAD